MIHPLFATLATEPGLIVDHLDAYADLAKAEMEGWVAALQTRWMLYAVLGASALLSVLLLAVAALLFGALEWRTMPYPWVLLVVPVAPILAALACWWRLRWIARRQPFALLREQIALDLKLIRAVNAGAGTSG